MTTTKTQLKLSEIALMLGPCLHNANCDFLGVPPRPFADLPATTQQAYYKRAELAVISGIGYLDAWARARAILHLSVKHDLFIELTEDGARLAETAMAGVWDEYDAQLMQVYQESQR